MEIALTRCRVRSFREDDAESITPLANNRRIWLNLRDGFPHPYSIENAREFIARARAARPETIFAIEIEGGAAGAIGLALHTDVERISAEIGYWVGEPYWGRGIATEALAAVTGHALATLGLARVYAVPYATNAASCRVLEKAGYVCEGRMRRSAIKDGVVLDQLLYACVLDEDPRAARAGR